MDFDELSGRVIAAAIAVHRALGQGFMESVYEEALKIEFEARGIKTEFQKRVLVSYQGRTVGNHVLDLVVEDALAIELKAVKSFEDIHYAQLRSYLKATGIEVGLLMNFNKTRLAVKRVTLEYEPNGPLRAKD